MAGKSWGVLWEPEIAMEDHLSKPEIAMCLRKPNPAQASRSLPGALAYGHIELSGPELPPRASCLPELIAGRGPRQSGILTGESRKGRGPHLKRLESTRTAIIFVIFCLSYHPGFAETISPMAGPAGVLPSETRPNGWTGPISSSSQTGANLSVLPHGGTEPVFQKESLPRDFSPGGPVGGPGLGKPDASRGVGPPRSSHPLETPNVPLSGIPTAGALGVPGSNSFPNSVWWPNSNLAVSSPAVPTGPEFNSATNFVPATNFPLTGRRELFPAPGVLSEVSERPFTAASSVPAPPLYTPPEPFDGYGAVPSLPPRSSDHWEGSFPQAGRLPATPAPTHLELPDMYVNPTPVAEIRRMEDLEILAQVGSSWILAGDIRPGVAEILEERGSSIPPHERPIIEKMATVRILDQMIETRLLYLAAKQRVPGDRLAEIEKRLIQIFETEELPRRMKGGNFDSVEAYRAKLENLGGSLEHERRLFIERAIASQWLHQSIGPIPEPDPGELLQYYQEHIHEFETPAQVRWEEVWVNIPRYSEGAEAWAKLAHVGNMLLQGMPLEQALAYQPSGEPRCYGQRRDWLPAGSPLVCPLIQNVLFQMPLGLWSEIFRVENRFYIVRVLERKEAVRTPFSEAQTQIRKQLVEQRRKEKIRAYLSELRSQTTIWTVFDQDPQAIAWRKSWTQGK